MAIRSSEFRALAWECWRGGVGRGPNIRRLRGPESIADLWSSSTSHAGSPLAPLAPHPPTRLSFARCLGSAVAIAAAVGLAASQPTKPNLPELIAGNRDLQLLAHVLENNGLIPTLSG